MTTGIRQMKIIDKILSDRDDGELKRGSVKGIQRKKKSNQNIYRLDKILAKVILSKERK